jgi:hypothetical protein
MAPTVETGLMALALTVALVAVEVLKRFYDSKRNGGSKSVIVTCPNKIESLAETMYNMTETLKRLDASARRSNELSSSASSGVSRLLDQHKATPDGIEPWKILPVHVRLWERIADNQEEMCKSQSQMALTLEKIAGIQTQMLSFLKNGSRPKS